MKTSKQIDEDIKNRIAEAAAISTKEQGARRKISALNSRVVFYKKCKEAISTIQNMNDDYVKNGLDKCNKTIERLQNTSPTGNNAEEVEKDRTRIKKELKEQKEWANTFVYLLG